MRSNFVYVLCEIRMKIFFLSQSTHNPDTACLLWAENKWNCVDSHSHAIRDAVRELTRALEAAPEGLGYPICPGSDLLTVRRCLKYPTAFQKVVYTYLCLCGRIVPRTLIKQCTHALRLAFQSRLRQLIWEQQPLSFFLPARRSLEQSFPLVTAPKTAQVMRFQRLQETLSWDCTLHISSDAEAGVNNRVVLQEVFQVNGLNPCSEGLCVWGGISQLQCIELFLGRHFVWFSFKLDAPLEDEKCSRRAGRSIYRCIRAMPGSALASSKPRCARCGRKNKRLCFPSRNSLVPGQDRS